MNKMMKRFVLAVLLCVFGISAGRAAGWPANYQGVMLQGFYWDSYDDTNWANLESQADELSQYFKLIWVPNSGKSSGDKNMGYMPIYWFSNHNSSFGTEAQLRSMIKTFKAKGTGIIADVVINHRVGVTGWGDFPTETWNGQTWHIGTDGICRTDEWGQGTGNSDTGDDFNAARDLDHTNANVQNNCKNYCKFLLQDLGYTGFRYDMVKGYSGQYTKMYNEYSGTQFSVGEYWDGSYDAVKAWIDATGKTSAAFDFPCKYAINDAFNSNDMTKLVWKANGTTPQPAGMIHFGYPQYAVTFIDNHDTYRDSNKFNGNVVAANAFILCSPGTPCVFLPHWKQYKSEIAQLISIRNAVGVHNMSAVNVLQSTTDCYMAEVTGTNGKLVVKIGSAMVSPTGYSNSDIKASGNGYCVWSKIGDVPTPPTPPTPGDDDIYLLGNLATGGWGATPGTGLKMTQNGTTYTVKGVELAAATGETQCYFNFTDYVGTTWDDLNQNANRYGSATEGEAITLGTASTVKKYANNVDASGCLSWTVAPGTYDFTLDLSAMTVTLVKSGDEPTPPDPTLPDHLYLIGNIKGAHWDIQNPVEMMPSGSTMTCTAEFEAQGDNTHCFFNFAEKKGADWDADVNTGHRYGAAVEGTEIKDGEVKEYTQYAAGVNASACKSFKVLPGNYNVTVDFAKKTVRVAKSTEAVDVLDAEDLNVAPVYYNLQGVRVDNPINGALYIVVRGSKVTKELVR